jgi:hypothetical protein
VERFYETPIYSKLLRQKAECNSAWRTGYKPVFRPRHLALRLCFTSINIPLRVRNTGRQPVRKAGMLPASGNDFTD